MARICWAGGYNKADRKAILKARRNQRHTVQGLRFAFYGRMSTEDFQDYVSSGRWQRDFAEDLVRGHGIIVAEYFDIGFTRALAWHQRPQTARLLAALPDPGREFDAIVVGEFERAFCGDQFLRMAPVFESYGIPVWLPELGGPVDIHNEMHLSLLKLLGVHAKREVQRARFRVKAAMRAQVSEQGRHLGGRPPYGYQLVDAGPHPNRAHAAWGRQLHRLEPDPAAAPWVKWMFAQRLAGQSVPRITRALNDQGVPCPSSADPDRNPHRSGAAWTLRTVASILANPRYTGRQVWNRQRTDLESLDDAGDLLGQNEVHRWNAVQQWVISKTVAHQGLISEQDFITAQAIHTAPIPVDQTARQFTLTGILVCEPCGRPLDAHWVHGRHAYRCRHGRTSSKQRWERPLKTIYASEDQALIYLATHIPELGHQDDNICREVAVFLDVNDVTIMCDYHSWRLEVNASTIADSRPPRMAPIPKQRQPHQIASTPTENRMASIEAVGK